MSLLFKKLMLSWITLNVLLVSNAWSSPTQITLLHNSTLLKYSQEVRLSRVLTDAYLNTNYDIYSLGSTLIDPKKQTIIDEKKQFILEQLQTINSPESLRITEQLNSLHFAYREQVEMGMSKARVKPKLDPMLRGEYQLLLPQRPDHILIIDSNNSDSLSVAIKPNLNIKDYLAKILNSDTHTYDSVWIIQPNQDYYQANDIQWKDLLYFLAPGAIVFTGLDNLPNQYSNLNENIAHLLTFHVEL